MEGEDDFASQDSFSCFVNVIFTFILVGKNWGYSDILV